jgi:hypothetical protein
LSLSYENRGFRTPYCGVAGQTLSSGFNGLVVGYSIARPAGMLICRDVRLMKVNEYIVMGGSVHDGYLLLTNVQHCT